MNHASYSLGQRQSSDTLSVPLYRVVATQGQCSIKGSDPVEDLDSRVRVLRDLLRGGHVQALVAVILRKGKDRGVRPFGSVSMGTLQAPETATAIKTALRAGGTRVLIGAWTADNTALPFSRQDQATALQVLYDWDLFDFDVDDFVIVGQKSHASAREGYPSWFESSGGLGDFDLSAPPPDRVTIRQIGKIPVPQNEWDSCGVLKAYFNDACEIQEAFAALAVDDEGRPRGVIEIALGGSVSVEVDNRILFAALLATEASAFAVAHNHPSGSSQKSKDEIEQEAERARAAELLGIDFLGSYVFANGESNCGK